MENLKNIEDFVLGETVLNRIHDESLKSISRLLSENPSHEKIIFTIDNLTPRGKKAIAMAKKISTDFNHSYIGVEHLLLSCLRDSGNCRKYLELCGVDWSSLADRISSIIQKESNINTKS
jgi:Clp amino terminal domain, pathogenicity island component